jgi:ATP-dependent RNA helicase RhlE
MSFAELGLSPELLRAVADEGYTEPTPVQREAIPFVLDGRDLLAGAQTGTGKTAAFVLPIIQLLHATRAPGQPTPNLPSQQGRRSQPATARPPVRVLVVVPTRELAMQVEESVRTYGRHRPIKSTTVYGGVGFGPQEAKLRGGPEIVVATPGRLLDHVGQRTIDLSRVEILVLDEADRLLDMGFIRDIRRILDLLPDRRQNLLFSATFSDDVRGLANTLLHDPARVQVTPRNSTTELVRQVVIPVDRERKRDLLRELVASGRVEQALVFTRTKHGANRLAEQLGKDGIAAAAIHGNKSQAQRTRALADFKDGRVGILVATDIAARGLDIEQLPHVVNYELPMVAEDYIHRIGRTGRAGQVGDAISLVCVDERPLLQDIQALLRRPIPTESIEGFEPNRSIRPEPIRLRSTPAERAERHAQRGETGRRPAGAGRGGQKASGRGSQPQPPAHGSIGNPPPSHGPTTHRRRRSDGRPAGMPTAGSTIGHRPPAPPAAHRGGPVSAGQRGGHSAGGHPAGGRGPGQQHAGGHRSAPSHANAGQARALPGERIRRLDQPR